VKSIIKNIFTCKFKSLPASVLFSMSTFELTRSKLLPSPPPSAGPLHLPPSLPHRSHAWCLSQTLSFQKCTSWQEEARHSSQDSLRCTSAQGLGSSLLPLALMVPNKNVWQRLHGTSRTVYQQPQSTTPPVPAGLPPPGRWYMQLMLSGSLRKNLQTQYLSLQPAFSVALKSIKSHGI